MKTAVIDNSKAAVIMSKKYPERAKDMPATQGMLYKVRDELKSLINSKFEGCQSEIHRLGLLMEEQNAKNNVVLDGLASLFGRQERVETRVEEIQRYIDRSKL